MKNDLRHIKSKNPHQKPNHEGCYPSHPPSHFLPCPRRVNRCNSNPEKKLPDRQIRRGEGNGVSRGIIRTRCNQPKSQIYVNRSQRHKNGTENRQPANHIKECRRNQAPADRPIFLTLRRAGSPLTHLITSNQSNRGRPSSRYGHRMPYSHATKRGLVRLGLSRITTRRPSVK